VSLNLFTEIAAEIDRCSVVLYSLCAIVARVCKSELITTTEILHINIYDVCHYNKQLLLQHSPRQFHKQNSFSNPSCNGCGDDFTAFHCVGKS